MPNRDATPVESLQLKSLWQEAREANALESKTSPFWATILSHLFPAPYYELRWEQPPSVQDRRERVDIIIYEVNPVSRARVPVLLVELKKHEASGTEKQEGLNQTQSRVYSAAPHTSRDLIYGLTAIGTTARLSVHSKSRGTYLSFSNDFVELHHPNGSNLIKSLQDIDKYIYPNGRLSPQPQSPMTSPTGSTTSPTNFAASSSSHAPAENRQPATNVQYRTALPDQARMWSPTTATPTGTPSQQAPSYRASQNLSAVPGNASAWIQPRKSAVQTSTYKSSIVEDGKTWFHRPQYPGFYIDSDNNQKHFSQFQSQ